MGWRRWCISSGRLQSLQGNTSDIFSDPAELNSLKKSSKDLNLCNFCWLRWFSLNRVTNHLLRRGRTPLWHASWNGSTSVMQMLLDAGAGVDAKSNGRLDEKIEKRMGLGQRGGISWFFMMRIHLTWCCRQKWHKWRWCVGRGFLRESRVLCQS